MRRPPALGPRHPDKSLRAEWPSGLAPLSGINGGAFLVAGRAMITPTRDRRSWTHNGANLESRSKNVRLCNKRRHARRGPLLCRWLKALVSQIANERLLAGNECPPRLTCALAQQVALARPFLRLLSECNERTGATRGSVRALSRLTTCWSTVGDFGSLRVTSRIPNNLPDCWPNDERPGFGVVRPCHEQRPRPSSPCNVNSKQTSTRPDQIPMAERAQWQQTELLNRRCER